MTYKITVERFAGITSTREDFEIRSDTDAEAQQFAQDITKACGSYAILVKVVVK